MGEMSKTDLQKMKQVDIRTVDKDSLVDIRDVEVGQERPQGQRLADFLRQIKNLYCFRCGKAVAKICFADTDVMLEERPGHYLGTLCFKYQDSYGRAAGLIGGAGLPVGGAVSGRHPKKCGKSGAWKGMQ